VNITPSSSSLVDQILIAKTTPPSAPFLDKEGNKGLREAQPFRLPDSAPLLDKEGTKGVVDTSAHESQIDEMVYKIFGLTADEIAIVEGRGGRINQSNLKRED
jgi:hypothetical protein